MTTFRLVTPEDIRRFRKTLKLTQKNLAKKAGVSQSLIARIENKSIDPRLSTLKKIIDVLTITTDKRIASDLMHSPVITIDIKDSVQTAVELMKKHSISQIPVLKENTIIGSIRESTIIDHLLKKDNSEKFFLSTVHNIIEKKFLMIDPQMLVDNVILLFSQGEPAVLVVTDNKLIGIITKIDVISFIINLK